MRIAASKKFLKKKSHCNHLTGIKVYEVYKVSIEDKVAQVLDYARWFPKRGLLMNKVHVWQRRRNLKGKHIKWVTQLSLKIGKTCSYSSYMVSSPCTFYD